MGVWSDMNTVQVRSFPMGKHFFKSRLDGIIIRAKPATHPQHQSIKVLIGKRMESTDQFVPALQTEWMASPFPIAQVPHHHHYTTPFLLHIFRHFKSLFYLIYNVPKYPSCLWLVS
jgi:hypothetical protein